MFLTVSATKPICPHDGIDYIYPSTRTLSQLVDCKGCIDVHVQTTPHLFCPLNRITTSTSVATPTTEYVTLCSPTTAYSQLHPRAAMPVPAEAGDAAKAACPTTILVSPTLDTGVTNTRSGPVVTHTSKVPCGGCSLVTATRLGGPGPSIPLKAPLTLTTSTTTVYQCA